MRGVTFSLSVPSTLAARVADRWLPALPASGWLPGLTLRTTEPPALPGPRWLRLRPLLSGVCASDLALVTGRSSPALSPFVSFPAVLGHEVVARIVEAGPGARPGLAAGERVVVDPFISCEARGLAPCDPCRRGDTRLCTRTAEGSLAPGMLIGYCRSLPGGWSDEMVAHESQLYPVPAAVTDEAAVLVEPLAVALHAVLLSPPPDGARVLVLGAGTIGLCTVAALRALTPSCPVVVVARHGFQREAARCLGAEPLAAGDGPGEAAVAAGARRHRPIWGRPVYAGGFDRIYDCAGTERSLDDALRVGGPGAHVVLVGCTGEARLDLSFVWARELRILGSYGYGPEPAAGGRHTFRLALDLLERKGIDAGRLVTHRFPLDRWREALGVSLRRARHGAIKVVFEGAPA